MRRKLSASVVQHFQPEPGQDRAYVWDAAMPGFGLMATAKGARSYIVQFRVVGTGRSRRMRIGSATKINLDEARRLARMKIGEVAKGMDPQAAKVAERVAHRAGRHDTVDVVLQRYLKFSEANLGWHRELKRTLERDVAPKWRGKAISDIADTDVATLVEAIAERAPIQANRTLTAVKMFLGWVVDRRILKASPAALVKNPSPEEERDRVLTDDELRAVWNAAVAEGYPFGTWLQVLLLTAQRRQEVAALRRSQTDLQAGTWLIPRPKNKRAHEVQLAPQVVTLLESVPVIEGADDSDLYFSTTGKTPISGLSKFKVRLDAASKVDDWIFHDLRRTATTGMASLGVPPHVCDKLLNHVAVGTIRGVARVYNRFEYLPERRTALAAWANHVDGIVSADPAMRANIVPLRSAAGAEAHS